MTLNKLSSHLLHLIQLHFNQTSKLQFTATSISSERELQELALKYGYFVLLNIVYCVEVDII